MRTKDTIRHAALEEHRVETRAHYTRRHFLALLTSAPSLEIARRRAAELAAFEDRHQAEMRALAAKAGLTKEEAV